MAYYLPCPVLRALPSQHLQPATDIGLVAHSWEIEFRPALFVVLTNLLPSGRRIIFQGDLRGVGRKVFIAATTTLQR